MDYIGGNNLVKCFGRIGHMKDICLFKSNIVEYQLIWQNVKMKLSGENG